MLHEFITTNRQAILARTRTQVASRAAPAPTFEELETGIPAFLDQLVGMLRDHQSGSGAMDESATLHGRNRLHMGFTLAQVVHDYGDVCQVVTELAMELDASITTEEFRTLNRCLDNAIANAVTEYARRREVSISHDEVERLGILAHELRNHLNTAVLAYDILKRGTVGIGGSTGAVLGRSLSGLQNLVDRTLAEVRLDAGVCNPERIDVPAFLQEIELAGAIAAEAGGMSLSVDLGEAGVEVESDRQLLGSAVSNLLQNAFKFTRPNGHVSLRSSASDDRVLIEVEDECGGLLPEVTGELFRTFHLVGRDKSGLGLGLMISRRAVESMAGTLRAHNVGRTGCVFTVDLPRQPALTVG